MVPGVRGGGRGVGAGSFRLPSAPGTGGGAEAGHIPQPLIRVIGAKEAARGSQCNFSLCLEQVALASCAREACEAHTPVRVCVCGCVCTCAFLFLLAPQGHPSPCRPVLHGDPPPPELCSSYQSLHSPPPPRPEPGQGFLCPPGWEHPVPDPSVAGGPWGCPPSGWPRAADPRLSLQAGLSS